MILKILLTIIPIICGAIGFAFTYKLLHRNKEFGVGDVGLFSAAAGLTAFGIFGGVLNLFIYTIWTMKV